MDFTQTALTDTLAAVEQAKSDGRLSADAARNLARWLRDEPYRKYFSDIAELVSAGEFDRLEDLFWQQIPFGTGGRRGPMGPFGSATINERTIAESAHGLAVYLKQQLSPGETGTAVVACDTRHRSQEFAELTATTLAAHGLKVFLFESFRSTPELSFAVRHLGCNVGAMISASHNPPEDNGFKAYWSSGGQVLAPHDKAIIKFVETAEQVPSVDLQSAIDDGRIEIVGEAVDEAFYKAILELSLSDARELPALYSPLHGVGERCCWAVLTRAGFQGLEIFEPHRAPDGAFPNVPDHKPNPEQPKVFEPMFEQGRQQGAELLLASDPDADRLSVCVLNPGGDYQHLTGNQVGSLIADFIARKRAARDDLTPEHYMVETLVTTRLIGAIARSHGLRVIDDLLVGFKYIGQTMDAEGPDRFVFGAEESLGYLAGQYARDKDAGIASLYLSECAAELRTEGKSLLDRLDELYLEHGYYEEGQFSKFCEGSEGNRQIADLMTALRESPFGELGGVTFDLVRDYQQHEIRGLPDNQRRDKLPQPDGNLLIFETADADAHHYRVAVRPSGTEPKIKFYLFGRMSCPDAGQLPGAKQATHLALQNIERGLNAWLDEQLT
jgi:phosphoglucomutase/phosphomannomutase